MSVMPGGWILILFVYALVAALIALLADLVLRFAIRDGLRGHELWLERTGRRSARHESDR